MMIRREHSVRTPRILHRNRAGDACQGYRDVIERVIVSLPGHCWPSGKRCIPWTGQMHRVGMGGVLGCGAAAVTEIQNMRWGRWRPVGEGNL